MKSIELYVDKIGANGRHGETSSEATIFQNFEKINKELFEEFTHALSTSNGSSVFFAAGRYVACVSMGFEDDKQIMSLMDIGKDESLAQKIIDQEPIESSRQGFMSAFRKVARDYNKEFNRYKLVLNDFETSASVSDDQSSFSLGM